MSHVHVDTTRRPARGHIYTVSAESLASVEDSITGRAAVALTVKCAMDHGPGVNCSQTPLTLGFESADDLAYLSAFLPIMGQQTFPDEYGSKALHALGWAMQLNDQLHRDKDTRMPHAHPGPLNHECDLAPLDTDICTYAYHAPSPTVAEMHGQIRAHALHFATHLRDLVPPGTERDMAMERLREAVMWANAGLALGKCNGYDIPERAQTEPAGEPEHIDEDNTQPEPAPEQPQPQPDHNPQGRARFPGEPVGYRAGLPLYDELSRRRSVV